MSQDTATSVRDLLPGFCFLNLEDDDYETLDDVTEVSNLYYKDIAIYTDHERDGDSDSDDESTTGGADDGGAYGLEYGVEDRRYLDQISNFMAHGCGCKLANGTACSVAIGHRALEGYRLNMTEIPGESLDLILLSHMQQSRINVEHGHTTQKTPSHTKVTERKIASVSFNLFGTKVCKTTYLFAHGIGQKRYKNLCKHFDSNGVTQRIHKNTGKRPSNAYTLEDEKHVITFIRNFADNFAMPLPGRMPRMKDYTVMMLPSDMTKAGIWSKYVESCSGSVQRAVGLTTFKCLWSMYVPEIAVMKVASDLCDICQHNNNLIMKSANASEDEKSERLKIQERHLAKSRECREYYRNQCVESRTNWNILTEDEKKTDGLDTPVHISFDYAQNLQIPHMPQQVGPIYFKTPRKCHLFGICCEAKPEQINYLIDENALKGKGANETVSYLDHYFDHHAKGYRSLYLHCDNCVGQNKNNCVMDYLCMRTITGLNDNIECSFMMPYHTRFGRDWCFGLIKQKYKKSYISSISQLADVVTKSTTKHINIPQLVADPTSGESVVVIRDWKPFLGKYFRRIPNIASYQHFRFSAQHPGDVFVRELPSSKEICITLRKDAEVSVQNLPSIIKPPGLTADRSWYLYDHIRQHCDTAHQDETCPRPVVPRNKGKRCIDSHPCDIAKSGSTTQADAIQ